LRDDGNIDNWFTCRKGSFDAPAQGYDTAKFKLVPQGLN
jgi:hypothetical protein